MATTKTRRKASNTKLNEARKEKGLTIADLALLMQVSKVTANNLIYDKDVNPRLSTIKSAVKVLNKTPEQLGFFQ